MGVASFTLRPLGRDLPVELRAMYVAKLASMPARTLGNKTVIPTGIRSQNRPANIVVAILTELSVPTYARVA
jgi:hypothetical protein